MKKFIEFVNEYNDSFDELLIKRWFNALINNDIYEMKECIELGVDVNVKDSYGDSAISRIISYKASNKNFKILKFLLEQPGIDINIQNAVGNTPLIISAILENINYIKILLKRPEIDITIKNIGGKTFMNKLKENYICSTALLDYELQKKILENGREDILLEFYKHHVLDLKIEMENPDLFKAADWGLI